MNDTSFSTIQFWVGAKGTKSTKLRGPFCKTQPRRTLSSRTSGTPRGSTIMTSSCLPKGCLRYAEATYPFPLDPLSSFFLAPSFPKLWGWTFLSKKPEFGEKTDQVFKKKCSTSLLHWFFCWILFLKSPNPTKQFGSRIHCVVLGSDDATIVTCRKDVSTRTS